MTSPGQLAKICFGCKIIKTYDQYSKDKRHPLGVQSRCKECNSTYRALNLNKVKATQKFCYEQKIEYYKEKARKRRAEKLESVRNYDRKYGKLNRGLKNSLQSKRRAAKLKATPPWLNKEHLKEIKNFYVEAYKLYTSTSIKHHVDHIIPLQNKNICGLHVPWNLQILTSTENLKKNNSFEYDISGAAR